MEKVGGKKEFIDIEILARLEYLSRFGVEGKQRENDMKAGGFCR